MAEDLELLREKIGFICDIDCVFYHIAGCPVYVAYNGSFLV